MTAKPLTELPLLASRSAYIHGAFVASSKQDLSVCDPATGATLVQLPSFGREHALLAVEAAERALSVVTTLAERRGWLDRITEAHATHREELAQIITAENGKPISEARGEVDYAAGFYREAARKIDCLAPRLLDERAKAHRWTVFARPAGVAGLIVPWNFPLAMLAKKASAALAAGAPMVVKPAEKTPLSSIALFQIFHGLGLPAGMVNLVYGDAPAIGQIMCEHPAVRVISFTGSTAIGKLLSKQAAPFVKKMALELGGNAPFVVFDDADLDRAENELMSNKFRCSGQTCVCTNRVYVQAGVYDAFAKRIAPRVLSLKTAPGKQEDSQVGPLIDAQGRAKVDELVRDAITRGAKPVVAEAPSDAGGAFYPPTLLLEVPAAARCLKEEVFGPVIPMVRFETEEEVIRAANDTIYGLSAYFFTADAARAERVASSLRFGHVGHNSATGPAPHAPFGGMKQSGLGREGAEEGILEFVELQTVAVPE